MLRRRETFPFIFIWLIVSMFLSGCVYSYRYRRLADGGYVVQRGSDCFPEFTIDDKRQYPKDLALAKERFKRRRKFVENWYKKYEPEDLVNPYIAGIKAFFLIPASPLIAVITAIKSSSELKKEELENSRRRYSEVREELRSYIVQDCQKENKEIKVKGK